MNKNFWVLLVFFVVSTFSHSLHASRHFEAHKTTFYRVFEPLLNAIGYKELKVQVLHEQSQTPISDAIVMVGEKPETLGQQNWRHTDQDGFVKFEGFNLPQGPLTITVAHKDYSRFTLFRAQANEMKVFLSPLENEPQDKALLSGEFTNWPEMEDHDGIMNAGFIIPFVDIISLINFSTDKMLAPKVKARIYKEVEVPGNLVLPSQEERMWGFIPVYVSKPTYQMPFLKGSKQNLIALAGDLPFKDMASGIINKKPLTDLLNLFSMKQFSFVLDYEVPQQDTQMDVALNYALKSRFQTIVNEFPKNKDIIYVSAGAFKENLNEVFPMDFKVSSRKAAKKQASLKSLAAHNIFPPLQELVMTIASDLPENADDKSKKDSALSGVLNRPSEKDTTVYVTAFLDLINLVNKANDFSYTKREDATYKVNSHMSVSFLNIESADKAKKKQPAKNWWTLVSPADMDKFTLPVLPEKLLRRPTLTPEQKLEWAINLFGFNSKDYVFDYNNLNQDMYTQGLTHFSRNYMKVSQ